MQSARSENSVDQLNDFVVNLLVNFNTRKCTSKNYFIVNLLVRKLHSDR